MSSYDSNSPHVYVLCMLYIIRQSITVLCPGFQKGRVPSEKGTLAR